MVTMALYVVLARRWVEVAPKGLRVAFRPSELGATLTLVSCVVPFEVTRKNLKVDLVIEVGIIFSEKVTVRLELRLTPVWPAVGAVVVTLGGVVSLLS